MLARRLMGGYFFCCDSIATINVAKEIIKIKLSNTVIRHHPLSGNEPPPMKALLQILL